MGNLEQTRHIIDIDSLTPAELRFIIEKSEKVERRVRKGKPEKHMPLQGLTTTLLTLKPTQRTGSSAQIATARLGGTLTYLDNSKIWKDEKAKILREPLGDIVANHEEMGARIFFARLFTRAELLEMIAASKHMPIVNSLDNLGHPTQGLADLAALQLEMEDRGLPNAEKDRTITYVGAANNVSTSLLKGGAMLGDRVVLSGPEDTMDEYGEAWERIQQLAKENGGTAEFIVDPMEATKDSDFVYTDTHVSMGEEDRREELLRKFAPWRVTQEMMANAGPDALFGHCLPAYRGQEVDASVIDGPQSITNRIAGHRMHTLIPLIKLLLKR